MGFFKKKCEFCNMELTKGKEIKAEVKVPEFTGYRQRDFCSEEHVQKYWGEVKGTKRTKFCPTCPV